MTSHPEMRERVIDANVLIDYGHNSQDREVLALIVKHLGPVFVPLEVFQEVRWLTFDLCDSLGFTMAEDMAKRGRFDGSYADGSCLHFALTRGSILLTSDGALLKQAESESIEVERGLRPMIHLAHAGLLDPELATNVAQRIESANLYITQATVVEFVALLPK